MKKFLALTFIFSLFFCIFLIVNDSGENAEGKTASAGVDACKSCHDEKYKSYLSSTHGKKHISGGPASRDACESCHGSGADHVSKGGGKGVGNIFTFTKKGDSKIKSSKCLACHEESRHIAFWDMGAHKKAGVSCNDCHTVHMPAGNKLAKDEKDLCFSCHKDIRMQFNKQSHHPVKEGLMKCSACHDVHGGFGNKQLKADEVNELCYKCHAEKRGPFMWQHAPVDERCLNCHEAHGSNHGRLLERKVPQLCQSCHDIRGGGHPSAAYTSSHSIPGTALGDKNKFFGRSCLNCHTNIHGSNGPGASGQLFLR